MSWRGGLAALAAVGVMGAAGLWTATAPPKVGRYPVPVIPPVLPLPSEVKAALQLYQDAPTLAHLSELASLVQNSNHPRLELPIFAWPLFEARLGPLTAEQEFAYRQSRVILDRAIQRAEPNRDLLLGDQLGRMEELLPRISIVALKAVRQDRQGWWPEWAVSSAAGAYPFTGPPNSAPVSLGPVEWAEARDYARAAKVSGQIFAAKVAWIRQRQWTLLRQRAIQVQAWQTRDLLPVVSMTLHPGWHGAVLTEDSRGQRVLTVVWCEARYAAFRLRLAARLGEPLTLPDPFAPDRMLRQEGGAVWSVGPDGVPDGLPIVGDLEYTSRGDLRL